MSIKRFSIWVEAREQDEAIRAAVLDAIPDDIKEDIQDESELLQLNTKSLRLSAAEILNRGEIKQAMNPAMEKEVQQAFEKGVTLQDLVDILQGKPGMNTQSLGAPEESVPPPSQPVNTGL
jgi:hypothetical protein